jgi:hypothetical protein
MSDLPLVLVGRIIEPAREEDLVASDVATEALHRPGSSSLGRSRGRAQGARRCAAGAW